MTALIVHGGCGIWLPYVEQRATAGCHDAVAAGRRILSEGGSAVDAVVSACVTLEDNPVFNSGTGSVLNYNGDAQMDASLMEGHTLRFSAVAAIEDVKNPILVARKVIEETDHSILSGSGAIDFARTMGFPAYDPRTLERIAEYKKLYAKVPQNELKVSQYSTGHPEHAHSSTMGTVGAVALDSHGNLATATTTGGMPLKLPGRLGDTPLPGGGTYATAYGASSSTGTGEYVMRILGTRQVCDLIAAGQSAQSAIERTLQQIQTTFDVTTGMIAIDASGEIGVAHKTPEMPHAFFSGEDDIIAHIRVQ